MCGGEDPTDHPMCLNVLEGARRTVPPKQSKKDPMTTEVLVTMCSSLREGGPSLRVMRFLCLAVLAFAGFLRISEALSLRTRDVSRSAGYLVLTIRKSKTDVYGAGAKVVVSAGQTAACPVRIFDSYLRLLGPSQKSNFFLFRPLLPADRKKLGPGDRPMNYSRAREELKHFLAQLDFDPAAYTWHQFRHGGATAASAAGVPERLISVHGRWKSEAARNHYLHDSISRKMSVSDRLGL